MHDRAHVWWGRMCRRGCIHGREHAWQWGACMAEGCAWQGACVTEGGMHGSRACVLGGTCVAGETATAAGGTQPTGMHSCYIYCVFSGLCNRGIDKLNTKYEESNCGRPSFGTL